MRTPGITLATLFCASIATLLCASDFADETHLSPRFRTVYIMAMSNSLDQHLASRLSSGHILWVVLEPSSADAVLTDSLDDAFWTWLQRNYPASNSGDGADRPRTSRHDVPPGGPFRGTIFLVDPRKRLVLWSAYEFPRDASPSGLDRTATRLTNQLKGALGRK
jgi:hypothetical protein